MYSGHPIRDIKQVVAHLSLECRGEEQTRDMFGDRPCTGIIWSHEMR